MFGNILVPGPTRIAAALSREARTAVAEQAGALEKNHEADLCTRALALVHIRGPEGVLTKNIVQEVPLVHVPLFVSLHVSWPSVLATTPETTDIWAT